jgi:hypothetical protein
MKTLFTCPRCDYETNKKTNIETHFKRKTICPNVKDIEITNEIKDTVIRDRVYHKPKEPNKRECATIKQLKLNNELLKTKLNSSNVDEVTLGGQNLMYLIQEREFVNTDVYKFGRTDKTINERLKGYSKGTIVIHTHKCKCSNKEAEYGIKRIFKGNVVIRPDIGSEYIEGNYYEICKLFMKYCLQDME